ncbi:MAG: GGDEF domain-containing protein [Rhodocyclales bacterium]|nr:GGDEF domain-containing protein [Rhodocyclales bacterium]
MILDMRTIVVMLVVSSVLMAITLAVGTKMGRAAGFVKWNAGLGLLALGWVLVAARGVLPDLVGVALADAMLVAGLCTLLAGLIEFNDRTAPRLLLIAPGPLVFALLIPLVRDYGDVTLLMGVALAMIFGAMAIESTRLGPRAGPARWMLALACFASAVMLMMRAVDIWLRPDLYPNVFATNNMHAAAFIVLFASTIVIPLAFLLMHRERAAAKLYELATTDPLTGLFNRRAFCELAEREFARARRLQSPHAVLMMDLDLFKRVNDEYGHQAGDRVLVGFAAVVKRCFRIEDLAGRYGGEEFCVVLPGATMEKAIMIAERLRGAVSQRPLGDLPRAITISIGIAACSGTAEASVDAAIGRADEALYRAKQEGRDRVVGLEFAPEDGSIASP